MAPSPKAVQSRCGTVTSSPRLSGGSRLLWPLRQQCEPDEIERVLGEVDAPQLGMDEGGNGFRLDGGGGRQGNGDRRGRVQVTLCVCWVARRATSSPSPGQRPGDGGRGKISDLLLSLGRSNGPTIRAAFGERLARWADDGSCRPSIPRAVPWAGRIAGPSARLSVRAAWKRRMHRAKCNLQPARPRCPHPRPLSQWERGGQSASP